MSSEHNQQIPIDMIADSIMSGRCVLLAGAGIADGAAPSAKELCDALIDAIRNCDHEQAATAESEELHRIAERLCLIDQFGPRRLTSTFLRAFQAHLDEDVLERLGIRQADRAEPGDLHKLISQIPFQAIATTNYDTLIETAIYNETLVRPWCITTDKDLSEAPRNWGQVNRTQIIKMHGCLDTIQRVIRTGTRIDSEKLLDEYVMSTTQYEVFFKNRPLIASQLRLWFAARPLLILGYSMRDLNFQRILQEAREEGETEPSHLIMLQVDPLDRSFWSRRGVHVYQQDVKEFLLRLKSRCLSPRATPDVNDLRKDLHAYWLASKEDPFPVAVYAAALKGEFDTDFVLPGNSSNREAKLHYLSTWLESGIVRRTYGLRGQCFEFAPSIRRGLIDRMGPSDERLDWEPDIDRARTYWDGRI